MKFATRTIADTDLDALVARLHDLADPAAKEAARAALRGANPELAGDALTAAIGSPLVVPRSEGPPTRPDVDSTRTAVAHTLTVLARALDEVEAAARRERARLEQAAGELPALLEFQQVFDTNRGQFIPAVERFAANLRSRVERSARRHETHQILHERFRAELARLADALP